MDTENHERTDYPGAIPHNDRSPSPSRVEEMKAYLLKEQARQREEMAASTEIFSTASPEEIVALKNEGMIGRGISAPIQNEIRALKNEGAVPDPFTTEGIIREDVDEAMRYLGIFNPKPEIPIQTTITGHELVALSRRIRQMEDVLRLHEHESIPIHRHPAPTPQPLGPPPAAYSYPPPSSPTPDTIDNAPTNKTPECMLCETPSFRELVRVAVTPEGEKPNFRWLKHVVDADGQVLFAEPGSVESLDSEDPYLPGSTYNLQIMIPFLTGVKVSHEPGDFGDLSKSVQLPLTMADDMRQFIQSHDPRTCTDTHPESNVSVYRGGTDDLYAAPEPGDGKKRLVPISVIMPVPTTVFNDTEYDFVQEVITELEYAVVRSVRLAQLSRMRSLW